MRQALRLMRGNVMDAEDLVQDAHVKCLANEEWPGPKLLTSVWIDGVRKRQGPRRRVSAVEFDDAAHGTDLHDPLRLLLARDVLDALDALPARHRDAARLVWVYGFTKDEAARLLSVPLGTVKSRLHRTRCTLMRQVSWQA